MVDITSGSYKQSLIDILRLVDLENFKTHSLQKNPPIVIETNRANAGISAHDAWIRMPWINTTMGFTAG